MGEQRVVVEGDLSVEREQTPVRSRDERVDLDQGGVGVEKGLVKAGQELYGRIDLLWLQAEFERDLPGLERLKPHARIDVLLQNCVRLLFRNLLDFHAACSPPHEYWFTLRALHQHAQLQHFIV